MGNRLARIREVVCGKDYVVVQIMSDAEELTRTSEYINSSLFR